MPLSTVLRVDFGKNRLRHCISLRWQDMHSRADPRRPAA
jgi:hypothetical protein